MMSVGATSSRRRPRRAPKGGCFSRLRSKYSWCCRSSNRHKMKTDPDRIDLVPASSLGQLFSWMLPCQRTTPPAARARDTLPHSIDDDISTAIPSAAASVSASAVLTAAGATVAAAAAGSDFGIAAEEEQNKHEEGESKIVDVRRFEAKADETADGDSVEDGEAVMIPLIDENEEVEAATFMPPAFRSSDDSALRKWMTGDVVTRAVDAQIGGGTFASVVLGETTSGRVPLAVKILRRESDDFGCQDKYINREVQTLSLAAHHPNVIDIYGVLSTAGTTFMIMPLVKTDLAKLMQDGPLTEEEAVPIVAQFLSALEHVHANKIVHRDLKPANLLLTHGNQVRLADFGFAKVLDEGEDGMTGLCGTKPYLSPEQVGGLRYGFSSDLWSAGVVIYELLHGRTAFCPDSSIDLGQVSMNFPPPEEGDIRMRLDPYDELERDNIRAGVFEVDSSRLGTMGEDFLRKLIILDPACRMSARTTGEHAWLGGKEVAALRRAEVTSITNERHEAQESESKERTLLLRRRRRKRIPKPVKTCSPAPVAEGGPASTTCSTSGVRSLLTTTSLSTAARLDVPRAIMVEESDSLGRSSEGASGQGAAKMGCGGSATPPELTT